MESVSGEPKRCGSSSVSCEIKSSPGRYKKDAAAKSKPICCGPSRSACCCHRRVRSYDGHGFGAKNLQQPRPSYWLAELHYVCWCGRQWRFGFLLLDTGYLVALHGRQVPQGL